jgi:pseudouridine synthase
MVKSHRSSLLHPLVCNYVHRESKLPLMPSFTSTRMPPKNAPRFLDYRQRKLPLDVALSFGGLPPTDDDDSSSARDLILSGRVLVNNFTERSCHRLVDRCDDTICVIDTTEDGRAVERPITYISKPKYFVCYKPRGVVCSRRRNEGIDREESVLISDWLARVFQAAENIIEEDDNNNDNNNDDDCSSIEEGRTKNAANNATPTTTFFEEDYATIKTVGRLDEESEGMLLLTNDGSFSRLLCDPEFGLTKTYRVVVRGSGYNKLINGEQSMMQYNVNNISTDEVVNTEQEVIHNELIKKRVSEKIKSANDTPSVKQTIHHFPFESCTVLDVGKLPSQHSSDDSYYALIDLVLCEGKRHAVRRICKNAQLRVCYLSRISVEGLDDGQFDVVKPDSIAEAHSNGFIPGGRHRDVVLNGKLISRSNNQGVSVLHSGHVVELRDCDVDRIFALREPTQCRRV